MKVYTTQELDLEIEAEVMTEKVGYYAGKREVRLIKVLLNGHDILPYLNEGQKTDLEQTVLMEHSEEPS